MIFKTPPAVAKFFRRKSKPTIGEQTPAQVPEVSPFGFMGGGIGEGVKGFSPPDPGTYPVCRRIAAYPTNAIALKKIVAPIVNAQVTWMGLDDSVSEDWIEFISKALNPSMPQTLTDAMLAIRYGFSPFEKVWSEREGRWVVELKPLLVDITEFLYNPKGQIVGLRNKPKDGKPIDLDWTHAFAWTYDGEAGNPYGRSRLENIRKRTSEVEQIIERFAKYLAKVAGIIGQIHYPDGTSKNAAGADWPNAWLAAEMARDAAAGKWMLIPNKFAAFLQSGSITPSMLEKALAAAGKSEWVVSFLDPSGTDFAPGFTKALEYYDKLLVRGLYQPERSIIEGQHGTKADAGSHNEMTAMDSGSLYKGFLRHFNKNVVDDMLVYNYGEKARGAVYAEAPPLADDSGESQDKTIVALLGSTNPIVSQTVARKIDIVALLEDRDIPTIEDEQDSTIGDAIDEAAAKLEQQQKQAAAQPAIPPEKKPINGVKKMSRMAVRRAQRVIEMSGWEGASRNGEH